MRDIVHRGITWRDFPGNRDNDAKKLAFAEFKNGLHQFNPHCEGLEGGELKAKLQELSQDRRVKWQRHFRRAGPRLPQPELTPA